MAVLKDLSYLGTLERYDSMYLTDPQTARSTDKAIHDTIVSNKYIPVLKHLQLALKRLFPTH